MKRVVSVLHFDRTFECFPNIWRPEFEQLSMTDIPGTNGYCHLDTLRWIRRRIGERKHRGLTLIGRGNYHYASFVLAAEVKEPFTLVLFDHHTDMMASPDERVISCGSWALEALKRLPLLRKVLLIGVSRESIRHIPAAYRQRVDVLPEERIVEGTVNVHRLIRLITTEAVYISIDKDVLSPLDAATDWDQGSMRLDQLLRLLEAIASAKRLAGVDICGEFPASPNAAWQPQFRKMVRKNEQANRLLVRHSAKWLDKRQVS